MLEQIQAEHHETEFMQSQRLLLLIPQPDLPSRYHPHSHKDNKTLILMVCMSEMYQRWPHGSRLHRTRIQPQSPFYRPCFYFKIRIPELELQLMCASQSFNDAAPVGPADTHQTLTVLTWNWSRSASGLTNDCMQTLEITLRHGGGFQLQHATWQECLWLLPLSWLAGANKNWLG